MAKSRNRGNFPTYQFFFHINSICLQAKKKQKLLLKCINFRSGCQEVLAILLEKSPSTECQRRKNPHENEYWQHFQQQRNGACVSRIAGPEKGQYAKHDKECRQHGTSLEQIYKRPMSDYDNRCFWNNEGMGPGKKSFAIGERLRLRIITLTSQGTML